MHSRNPTQKYMTHLHDMDVQVQQILNQMLIRYDIILTQEICESRIEYGYKKNYMDNYIDAHTQHDTLLHDTWIWMRYDTDDKSMAWIQEKFCRCTQHKTTHSYMMH